MKTLLFCFLSLSCHGASITFSSNPSPLTITQAIPGRNPLCVIDTSTTCDLIVSPKKTVTILAALDSPLPPHTTLKIGLFFPHQKSSLFSLGPTPQPITSPIPEGFYNSICVTYEYAATVAAGVIPPQTKTIFFTLLEKE